MKPPFSPYEGEEEYIFVSYSHKDAEKVYKLIKNLYDRGYRIWYDEGIMAGTIWNEIIAQHIIKATLMLLFISPDAVVSVPVNEEIAFAKRHKIPIVPIFLCKTKISDGLELQLSMIQWEFYYEYVNDEAFFNKLLSSPLLKYMSTTLKSADYERKTLHEQIYTTDNNVSEENIFFKSNFRKINDFFGSSENHALYKMDLFNDAFFSESEVWGWKYHMLNSYEDIFKGMKAKIVHDSPYKFFISISIFDEVIIDAILNMMKEIKDKGSIIKNLTSFKIASHLAYWWLRHKPVSILYPSNFSLDDVQINDGDYEDKEEERQKTIWKLKHINELIAVQISATYVFNFENCLCVKNGKIKPKNANKKYCCIDFEKTRKMVLQKLSYYFSYKTITTEILEYILKYLFDQNGILSIKCKVSRKTWT